MSITREVSVSNWDEGTCRALDDRVVAEAAVALTYNKRSHVVMMVTPSKLEDFATGFSLTEGIIKQPADVLELAVIKRENGLEVAMTVSAECFARLEGQRRNLVGRTGCGLCGAESLATAVRNPAAVSSKVRMTATAIQTAVQTLNDHQPLQAETGAVHGAAWCSLTGKILALREDIGRHNAVDKILGKLINDKRLNEAKIMTVSGRISYEIIIKCFKARVPFLAAVSAPSSLSVDFAKELGITLFAFCRDGRATCYSHPQRTK